MWVCTPPLHHRGPAVDGARGRHPRLPREADRAHDGRRRGDRRGRRRRERRGLRRRLPVARDRAARRRAPGARGPAGGHARRAQLRPGERPAVVRRPGAGRRPAARARQPPHRPAARDRGRDRRRADGGRDRCGWPRRTVRAATSTTRSRSSSTSRTARSAASTAPGRPTASPRCTRPTSWPPRRRSRSSSAPTGSASRAARAPSTLAGEYGDPMDRSIARFLEAARSRRSATGVFCRPADALRTLAVALACERALESGAVVSV